MLMTLVPLFDESMTVKAYSLFAQKNSYFQNTRLANQEAVTVDGLDVIRSMAKAVNAIHHISPRMKSRKCSSRQQMNCFLKRLKS